MLKKCWYAGESVVLALLQSKQGTLVAAWLLDDQSELRLIHQVNARQHVALM